MAASTQPWTTCASTGGRKIEKMMIMEKFDYAKAMAELEQIAAKVEDPKTSLDDIGALVKRSQELAAACREYLRTVRETIEKEEE